MAAAIGLPEGSHAQAIDVLQKLYTCYMETDASLVEINPLNCDSKGNLIALDAKFNFDSNALFRHPEIVALREDRRPRTRAGPPTRTPEPARPPTMCRPPAPWRSGYAAACKAVYTGSNPVRASSCSGVAQW